MNIKKTVSLFLVFLSCSVIYPQHQFLDAPFGGGGGFTPGWIFVNTKAINPSLALAGMPVLPDNGIFTTGGSGFIYIGFIPNLRVGGMGFGGNRSAKLAPSSDVYYRETEYSVGGGGVTFEYTLPFIRDIGISVGAIIGGGGVEVNLYKNTSPAYWNDIINHVSTTGGNVHTTLKNNYWIVTPTLNVEIPIYHRFVALRVGAGYQFTLGEEWEYDNGISIPNAPSDLNGRAFFIQAGLYAGFFSF